MLSFLLNSCLGSKYKVYKNYTEEQIFALGRKYIEDETGVLGKYSYENIKKNL